LLEVVVLRLLVHSNVLALGLKLAQQVHVALDVVEVALQLVLKITNHLVSGEHPGVRNHVLVLENRYVFLEQEPVDESLVDLLVPVLRNEQSVLYHVCRLLLGLVLSRELLEFAESPLLLGRKVKECVHANHKI